MPLMLLFLSIFFGAFLNKKKIIYISLFLFYIISTPFFANNFLKIVEGQYDKFQIEKINEVDAIVVLGGSIRINEFQNKYMEIPGCKTKTIPIFRKTSKTLLQI